MQRPGRKKIRKIRKYADFGIEAAQVLRGFNRTVEAGSLESVLTRFKDENQLFRAFQREDDHVYF